MTAKQTVVSGKSNAHWVRLFALLSLDGVSEVYDLLGLSFVDRVTLLHAIRDCILFARGEHDKASIEPDNKSALFVRDVFLSCLSRTLPQEVFRHLDAWLNVAFLGDHSEQPQQSAWEIVLRQLKDPGLWPQEIPAIDMEWLTSEFRHANRIRRTEWNRRVSDIKQRNLSDWDGQMYLRHSWNHFSELGDPFTVASLMSSNHFALRTLILVKSKFTLQSIEALQATGNVILEKLGIWMPSPLASVYTMVEAL